VKKDFIMPILVLSLICLIISGSLAICDSFTRPLIEGASVSRAADSRRDVLPDADGFELLALDGLPKTIKEVYKATNGAGYIFMITTSGYGGEIRLICGIDAKGTIVRSATLAQSETKGLGTLVFEEPFESRFAGKDKDLNGISAISGATISSNAYINGIRDAFEAYDIVTGGGR